MNALAARRRHPAAIAVLLLLGLLVTGGAYSFLAPKDANSAPTVAADAVAEGKDLFIAGQVMEYSELVHENVTLSSDAYGSVFYMATGFHGLHVTGGLIAFLLIIARTFTTRRYTHANATGAVVTSYYWHFVDVVWIALFATIYILR